MNILFSSPKNPVREPKKGLMPRLWASLIPFRHPENFMEVFRAIWENRDNLPYAYRVLTQGTCDGCALGTNGLEDWTVHGIHLCNVRLRLLRLSTIGEMDMSRLHDVSALQNMRGRELRAMGRICAPMIREAGDAGFREISWDEALDIIAEKIRATEADRSYFYLTSRGIPNETYYSVQKAVRAMGTNNVDNAARICHSPSTFGLKDALGVAATTCSYSDMIGTDVVTFFGSNVASNQPVVMKYLYHAKKAGTKVVMVNPYREPGMEEYWIPSDLESAVFGTKMTDEFYQIRAGGDMAFLQGVTRIMIENGWYDENFITEKTAGFDDLKAHLLALSWETLETQSGVTKADMEVYARTLHNAEKAVFVWGMGITQHTCGEDNVHSIINLALLKGFVGRRGCGLMPIRGHSGVQGGAEMGAYASVFPGGLKISDENAAKMAEHWGFDVPTSPGLTTAEMMQAAGRGEMDVLFAAGGNFRKVMPDPKAMTDALANIPLRVHMDIAVTNQMFVPAKEAVILLPAVTRYEIPGGVTETSTERRIMFSPEVKGERIANTRSEGDVVAEIAARVKPELADKVRFASTDAIREEIARVIPLYDGIQNLKKQGDNFQYGGALLCDGWNFPTDDGRAHFKATDMVTYDLASDEFIVVTRRGKQFNSIIHEDHEARNHLGRFAVMMNEADAKRMGMQSGDKVQLESETGEFSGHVAIEPVAAGTIEVYWPEGNTLIDPDRLSPLAKIPAFKSIKAKASRV